MNTEPQISVVIPVYCVLEEHEEYLVEALTSVARQTFREIEVIVVDDASPQNIAPVLERTAPLFLPPGQGPELRVIRNEQNLRQAGARNVGVEAARGEFLAFIDQDDVWEPEKLERQMRVLAEHPEAAMVFCDVRPFGPQAHRMKIDQSRLPERVDFEWFMRHGNYVITVSAVMVRRSALLEIGLFDPRYTTSDDLDAWLKIARKWQIIHMSEKLAGYRLHSSNLNYGVDRLNDTRLLFRHYWDYFKSVPPAKKVRLLRPMIRKIGGQIYFRVFRRRGSGKNTRG